MNIAAFGGPFEMYVNPALRSGPPLLEHLRLGPALGVL